MSKYERIDLGNVRGKEGLSGHDGYGIKDVILDEDYHDPGNPFDHRYKIIYEDDNKEPSYFIVKDGENLSLINEVDPNSDSAVKSRAIYNKLLTKAEQIHTHGQISTDGKIGSASNKPIITTTDGELTTGTFSNQANTFAEGNHVHGNITNDGKVGTTANYFVYTTTGGKVTSKQKVGNITTAGAIGSTANKPVITGTSGVLQAGSFSNQANTFSEGNHVHGNLTNDGKVTGNNVSEDNFTKFVGLDSNDTLKNASKLNSNQVIDPNAHSVIDTIANESQSTINTKVDEMLGDKLDKSVNLNASSTNIVDLNDIISTGFYYQIGNTNCKYVNHKPLDTAQATTSTTTTTTQNPLNDISFYLTVEKGTNEQYVKQTYTSYYNNSPRTFIRTLMSTSGWGEWAEVQVNNIHEFVPSTQSASTNEWTGKLLHTNTIQNGTVIYYNLRKAPTTGNVSLNLTLPNGSTTGAKNVLLLDSTRLTNQFPTNSTIAMVYNGSTWRVINPVIPSSTNTDIKMNGLSASAGTSTLYARADHIHPSDDSKLDYGADYPSNYIVNSSALSTIGSSANATQQTINTKIDEKLASINTTIVNQGAITVDATLSENSQNPVMSSGLWNEFKSKVDKEVVSGGTNLLKGDPVNTGGTSTTGSNYTIESDLYHGNKIYHRDETSYETSKYGDLQWIVLPNEFTYGDVFTLSFYAKGTSGKEIRTYFYGDSGYVNVKRIASNSVQDSTPSGSWHDGATRFTLTTDWKHYYVTYQLNTTGTLSVNKKLCIRVYGGTDAYISNVQLERGDNVTDYRPNVMDELNNRALANHTHPYTDLEDPIGIDSSSPMDYNDYTAVGHYKVWSTTQSHADTLNKPPSDTQGGLLVVEKIPNGYLQILYNYYRESPKIHYRIYHTTSGWRDWQTFSVDGHTHLSTDLKSVPLTATQEAPVDLNNITNTGFYYNNANTQCQYITPLPVKNTAFWLLVEDWASSSYTKQTLTHYHDGGFTYVRIRNGGNWQPWKKIKDENDTPQRYSSEIIHNSTVINDYTWIDETYYFNGWSEWDVYGDMKFSDTKKRFEIHKYGDTGLKNFIGIGVSGDTGALTCWWGTSSSAESTYAFKDNDNNYIIPSVNTWYSFRLSRRGKYIIFEFDNKYVHSVEASYFTGFERISPRLFSYKTNGTVSCRGLTIQPKQSSMDNLIMCKDITSNADLNNYIHQSNGYYRCNTSAIAQSLTNCPTQWAFNMVVYQMGETTSGTAPVRQEIRPYRVNSNDQVIYARNYFSGTWEDWQMYAPVSDDVNDIKMNGTASVGSKYTSARSDHVHPSDTSKLDKIQSDHKGKNVVTDSSTGEIIFEDKINPSSTAPLTQHYKKDGVVGTSTDYARADHQHSYVAFNVQGTSGIAGYVKAIQLEINSTYQDLPISFYVTQRNKTKVSFVNIRFANSNTNDPALSSLTHSGENGEFYLYKESASTWSFIIKKGENSDRIGIFNLVGGLNGAITITKIDTQLATVPNDATQSTYTVGGTPFGTTANTVCQGNDSRLSNTRNPTINNKAPTSSANNEIDNFTTTGFYTFFNNASVSNMNETTLPTGIVTVNGSTRTGKSFYLIVEAKDTGYVKQTLTKYDNGQTWIRIKNKDASPMWSSWQEISFTTSEISSSYVKDNNSANYSNMGLSQSGVSQQSINTAIDSKLGTIPTYSSSLPLMDGTAKVGDDTTHYARADHVHPKDTSKVNTSDIIDNLTTSTSGKVLSAKQGKTLNDKINGLISETNTYYKNKYYTLADYILPVNLNTSNVNASDDGVIATGQYAPMFQIKCNDLISIANNNEISLEIEGSVPIKIGRGLNSMATINDPYLAIDIILLNNIPSIYVYDGETESVEYYTYTGNGGDSFPDLYFMLQTSSSVTGANITETTNHIPPYSITINKIADLMYPVGSIYMSINSENPRTLFGGLWEQIEDTFLLACGTNYANGETGGSADAVVVSHTHTQAQHRHELTGSKSIGMSNGDYLRAGVGGATDGQYTNYSTPTINSTGVDGTGKNMPPYLAVYMWKRIA